MYVPGVVRVTYQVWPPFMFGEVYPTVAFEPVGTVAKSTLWVTVSWLMNSMVLLTPIITVAVTGEKLRLLLSVPTPFGMVMTPIFDAVVLVVLVVVLVVVDVVVVDVVVVLVVVVLVVVVVVVVLVVEDVVVVGEEVVVVVVLGVLGDELVPGTKIK